MGLFDFLRSLFGGGSQRPPRVPTRSQAPAPQTSWPAAGEPARPRAGPTQPRETKLQLDAAQFQPLPADQFRAQALSTQFTGFFEFGRRDRIPSPLDPRTKLIDQ